MSRESRRRMADAKGGGVNEALAAGYSLKDRAAGEAMLEAAVRLGQLARVAVRSRHEAMILVQHIGSETAGRYKEMAGCRGKGCHWCCKADAFRVAPEEVDVLAPLVTSAAWARVRALAGLTQEEAAHRDCPLLDPVTKGCSVYDRRPMICRTYLVATPAENCATDGKITVIGDAAVFTIKAAMQIFPENPMTGILWRELLARAPSEPR